MIPCGGSLSSRCSAFRTVGDFCVSFGNSKNPDIFFRTAGVTFSNEHERSPFFLPLSVSVGTHRVFFSILLFDEIWTPEETREDKSPQQTVCDDLHNGKEEASEEEEEMREREKYRRREKKKKEEKGEEKRKENENEKEKEECMSLSKHHSDRSIPTPKYVQKVSDFPFLIYFDL